MSLSFDSCMLSGRGLWVGLITRPEESYRVWCVCVCVCVCITECDQVQQGVDTPTSSKQTGLNKK